MIVVMCDHKSGAIEKGERAPVDAAAAFVYVFERDASGHWQIDGGAGREPMDGSTLGGILLMDRSIKCPVDSCPISVTIGRDGFPPLVDYLERKGLERVSLRNLSDFLRASALE